ncbi:unnamed protein product [Psylliodes chrysocephalus]|uniref:Protein-serine O-palmitoleoyltransferase porcupine n=1 Tax=Psylliodes chrysocephalus TaxID=3402493 RepID=A0A9P0CKV5_9CUCU|nr:unnamed protein product [Psylliodes chrysocephala]
MTPYTLAENEDSLDFFYENEIIEETSQIIWENCVIPSTLSIIHIIYKIVLVNFMFAILVSSVRLGQNLFHALSGSCGIYLISHLESTEGKLLVVIFFSLSYLILFTSYIQKKYYPIQKENIDKIRYLSSSNIIKYALIIILVLCEYFLMKTETWMEIRGLVMIFSMKLISLADDIDKDAIDFPNYFQYFGYIFSGANVMFGPWISFQDYILMYNQPTKKNLKWILSIARALLLSIFFLTVSNCWTSYIIKDDMNIFLVSYKEALSFRTSHYFVSFLSEASMLAAGLKNIKIWNEPNKWQYKIVDPLKIELPTALATVVTHWNKPMHDFLKKYVYKCWLPLGKFYGILATFIMSSFLHGFELKVSVVLISIGIFSYLQFAARDYFARAFNCCIRVYPCRDGCTHKYKRCTIIPGCFRLFFSVTNIIHLIYLGMLMDPSTDDIGIIKKWKNLYFISFWLMFVNVLIVM